MYTALRSHAKTLAGCRRLLGKRPIMVVYHAGLSTIQASFLLEWKLRLVVKARSSHPHLGNSR